MSGNDDLPGVGLRASDVFMADFLALLRHLHGVITPEQLDEAVAMNDAASLAWYETEFNAGTGNPPSRQGI